jgi:hypothetical protein
LLVSTPTSPKPKLSRISDWQWKAGVIRCASHLDLKDPELQVLVEFDDVEWQTRDWLNVYKDNFHLLAVEANLVLANRPHGPQASNGPLHPALTFTPLVDSVGLWKGPKGSKHPVEFLADLKLDFQDCNKVRIIRHWDKTIPGLNTSSINEKCVRDWSEFQDCQQILTTTPSVLLGFRLQVYRAEGTTQWYTVVTTGYNETTNEFTLTDDTVLEEHFEDPRLTQIKVLGEGVVESILKGDTAGITPRRSRSSTSGLQQQSLPTTSPPSRNTSSSKSSQENNKVKSDKKNNKQPKQTTTTTTKTTNTTTDSSPKSSSAETTKSPTAKLRGRPPSVPKKVDKTTTTTTTTTNSSPASKRQKTKSVLVSVKKSVATVASHKSGSPKKTEALGQNYSWIKYK